MVLAVLLTLTSCKGSSQNEGALRYKNGGCIAYYPDNKTIKEYAKKLCETRDKQIYDFTVKKMGDFLLVSYEDGLSFYTENDFKDLSLEVKDNLDILSNELRYQMKKDNIDMAYTTDFILATSKDKLDPSKIDVSLDNDDLVFYFEEYDYGVKIPLVVGQQIVGRNFGFEEAEYIYRRYVNPDRPMVAFTFDDGPYSAVDEMLYDLMDRYDSRCTFYFVGNRLGNLDHDATQKGIKMGFEYGSHTYDHEDLSDLSFEEAKDTVCYVSDYFMDNFNYKMNTYRPPYGHTNQSLENAIDMVAILWNADTRDWENRDEQDSYIQASDTIKDGSILLAHSLYESTAKACTRLVPELIDEGYQLVTVSELLQALNIQDKVFSGK